MDPSPIEDVFAWFRWSAFGIFFGVMLRLYLTPTWDTRIPLVVCLAFLVVGIWPMKGKGEEE